MTLSEDLAAFRRTSRLDDLTIESAAGWTLSVRPAQLRLGAMVLSATEGEKWFADLDLARGPGLLARAATAERLAKGLYGAERVNLVALMMKDPVVHFHALPRYSAEVEHHGLRWRDEDWPGPPTFGPAPTDDDVLFAIRDELRAAR